MTTELFDAGLRVWGPGFRGPDDRVLPLLCLRLKAWGLGDLTTKLYDFCISGLGDKTTKFGLQRSVPEFQVGVGFMA